MIEKSENGVSPPKKDLFKNLKKDYPLKMIFCSNFNQNLLVHNVNYFST